MIKVNCPTCGVRLTAPDELINKPVNCQKCNTKFILSRRWTSEPLTVAGDGIAVQGVIDERSADEVPLTESLTDSTDPQVNSESVSLLGSDSSMGSSAESNLDPSFDFTLSSATLDDASEIQSESLSIEPAAANGSPKRQALSSSGQSPAPPVSAISQVTLAPSLTEVSKLTAETASTTNLQNFRETASIWQFFDFQFRAYLTPGIVRISWFLILMVTTFWLLFLSYFFLSSIIQRKEFLLPTVQNQSAGLPTATDAQVLVVPRFFYNSAMYFTYTIASIVGLLWIRVLFETVMMVFSIGSHLQVKPTRQSTRKK